MRDAIQFDEYREDGKHRALGSGRHLEELDYNSELILTPDPAKLTAVAGSLPSVLPPLDAVERTRLEEVEGLLRTAVRAGGLAEQAAAALARGIAKRDAGALSAEETKAIQQILKEEAAARDALLEHVRQILRAEGQESPPLSEDDLDVKIESRMAEFTPPSAKIDLDKVRAFLQAEMEKIVAGHDADVRKLDEALASGSKANGLRVRARLLKDEESHRVHVENYDDLEDSFVKKPPRLSAGSEEDHRRLERELGAIQVIVEAAEDVRSGEIDVGAELKAAGDALKKALEDVKTALRDARDAKLSGFDD